MISKHVNLYSGCALTNRLVWHCKIRTASTKERADRVNGTDILTDRCSGLLPFQIQQKGVPCMSCSQMTEYPSKVNKHTAVDLTIFLHIHIQSCLCVMNAFQSNHKGREATWQY